MKPIEYFWKKNNFQPNEEQKEAILTEKSPLFLSAGPGSGKTRVLLWKTFQLIVYENIPPDGIFLSTFTEKAAKQLKEGIRYYLSLATQESGIHYDISRMYVGTIHSNCNRLLTDRRILDSGEKPDSFVLMDELDQYLFLNRKWNIILKEMDEDPLEIQREICEFFYDSRYRQFGKKHDAISACIATFNRFSEEWIKLSKIEKMCNNSSLEKGQRNLCKLYLVYRNLINSQKIEHLDLSLIQSKALEHLRKFPSIPTHFEYVIIDEYQDTNSIQEEFIFELSRHHKKLCVVGDDDQALYRFRGASVSNIIEFTKRVQKRFSIKDVEQINLKNNYRSRKEIVHFYKDFITDFNWKKQNGQGNFRVSNKEIIANNKESTPSVFLTPNASRKKNCTTIANFVKDLVENKGVKENQIAFLFSRFKANPNVNALKKALEHAGLSVYAPRAGRYFDQEEPRFLLYLFLEIFGVPEQKDGDYKKFITKIRNDSNLKNIYKTDRELQTIVSFFKDQIDLLTKQYLELNKKIGANNLGELYNPTLHESILLSANSLTAESKKIIKDFAQKQRENPYYKNINVGYVINSVTALDWNILDAFYRLTEANFFRDKISKCEGGSGLKRDEGPIWNLSILTKYLSKYKDNYHDILSARILIRELGVNSYFQNQFFNSFLYGLYKRQESEFENEEDPFPEGRIPFLTIHQSKGLEFPIVILGDLDHSFKEPGRIQIMMEDLVPSEEPLERITDFDAMRKFYVALSRAENLLVMVRTKEDKNQFNQFEKMFQKITLPEIQTYDFKKFYPSQQEIKKKVKTGELPNTYFFTTDYQFYKECPRRYMLFTKYDFVPSRTQTQLFGIVVHQSIEDIHRIIISGKKNNLSEKEIRKKIELDSGVNAFFEDNYRILKLESGHTLGADAYLSARDQVYHYWEKLSEEIAFKVNDTEVRLNLPNIEHPTNIKDDPIFRYNLEGIVDIVSQDGKDILYDLKTHYSEDVKKRKDDYAEQLNIYAHIWTNLHKKKISGTGIIATRLPPLTKSMKKETSEEKAKRREAELKKWEPVVPLNYDPNKVKDTIHKFGETIFEIEKGNFQPPPVGVLRAVIPDKNKKFATSVCNECDGRFSCKSYKAYTKANKDESQIFYPPESNEIVREARQMRDEMINTTEE
jgi:DNA helicase II / ATP-dependent DNA helicase PcrA